MTSLKSELKAEKAARCHAIPCCHQLPGAMWDGNSRRKICKGSPLGEGVDERTNTQQKERSAHAVLQAAGEAGDCGERLQRVKDPETHKARRTPLNNGR